MYLVSASSWRNVYTQMLSELALKYMILMQVYQESIMCPILEESSLRTPYLLYLTFVSVN